MNLGAQATTEVNGTTASRYLRDEGAPARLPHALILSHRAAPPVERSCKRCGDSFMVEAKEAKRGRGTICSPCARPDRVPEIVTRPTVQIRTLEPGTKFRIDTTEAEVVRQKQDSTEVRYMRNSKTPAYSVWPNSCWVRVL